MKVTTIGAVVRFSRPQADRSYKTVELSAEATFDPAEAWKESQDQLYADLSDQLKALLASRKPSEQRNGQETTQDTPPERYCAEHGVEFRR